MKKTMYVQAIKLINDVAIRVSEFKSPDDDYQKVLQLTEIEVDIPDYNKDDLENLFETKAKEDLIKRKADMEASLAEINTQIEGVK